MNNFLRCENLGRDIFKAWADGNSDITAYTEPTDPYATYDASFNYKGQSVIVELKYRKSSSTAYSTWILEQKKYKGLELAKCRLNVKNVWYVNIFTDGNIYAWPLDEEFIDELTPVREMYRGTTAGDNTAVAKIVYHLPLDIATNLLYIN